MRVSLLPILAAVVVITSIGSAFFFKAETAKARTALLNEAMARNDLRAKQLADTSGQLTAAILGSFGMALQELSESLVRGDADATIKQITKNLPSNSVNQLLVTDPEGRITHSSES